MARVVADTLAERSVTPLRTPPYGVDGEGEDGKYVLLSASNGVHRAHIDNRKHGLTTRQCLEFLLDLPGMDRIVFGFAFTYDVNMILCDLDMKSLKTLADTGRVYWEEYRIKHVEGKLFQVTHRPSRRSVSVWDLYPWIQSSFVKMLEEFELADKETVARIKEMKDKRDSFRDISLARIKEYNYQECELLSKAVSNILGLIDTTGYHTRVYYSPGSLASAAMDHHKTRQFRKEPPKRIIDESIEAAYFGGRSEVNRVGPVEGPIYEYDIRSAYPYQASLLPCFACGKWVKFNGTIERTSLVKVRWQTDSEAVWGPFPYRPATGSLKFPRAGETWVWGVEALAGIPLTRSFEVIDGYTYLPGCDHRPFAWLEDIYRARQKLKSAGNPQEYVYKLILNSAYGKLAEHSRNYTPKHRFMPWAGLITAGTRAMLLDQIARINENLLSCATDGILTSAPLPVEIGKGLGQWEAGNYSELFIAGPGFYFADGRSTESAKARSRGIARADVSYDRLREEWLSRGRMGQVRISTRRFIGYRLALKRLNGADLWRQFVDVEMVKTFELEPRREWVSDDVFDGRTIAPSLKTVKRVERKDDTDDDQLSFQLWNEVADKGRATILNGFDPYGFDPTSQPDYLIDELSQG